MNRTEYKNNFYKEHYKRIRSVNSYIQDLVRKDQCGMFERCRLRKRIEK